MGSYKAVGVVGMLLLITVGALALSGGHYLSVPVQSNTALTPDYEALDTTNSNVAVSPDGFVERNPDGIEQDPGITHVGVKTNAWDRIVFGVRKLINNVWGIGENEALSSSIFCNGENSFGSAWNRGEPKTTAGTSRIQPIFPNVRIGGSPWEPSTSQYFPIRTKNVKSLRLDLSYKYPEFPSGSYNLAYDMFFMDTNESSKNPSLKAELMIWIHGTKMQPLPAYIASYDDGHNTYDLFSWRMSDGRLYYSFVMTGEPTQTGQYTVDARRLLSYLPLDPDWYIPGLELGNEIWRGAGKIEISKFGVNLNGRQF